MNCAINEFSKNRYMLNSYVKHKEFCLTFCAIPEFYKIIVNSLFYQYNYVNKNDIGAINISSLFIKIS